MSKKSIIHLLNLIDGYIEIDWENREINNKLNGRTIYIAEVEEFFELKPMTGSSGSSSGKV